MPRIVGYTADADIYCPDCTDAKYGPDITARRDSESNRVHPVWNDSEWDTPQHCHTCGAFLLVRLTDDGCQYVREQGPNVPEEWRAAYPEAF